MGALTEREIFSCLEDNCRTAIDACDQLAISPVRGVQYNRFWEAIDLAMGCFRQASYWRQDARWLPPEHILINIRMAAGEWIRGYSLVGKGVVGLPRLRLTERELGENFKATAKLLRKTHKYLIGLRDDKTGRTGMILPKPVANFRETRQHRVADLPPAMMKTSAGLIVPSGVAAQ
jgi:hypothetical protein